jgi:UDP-glucose 4-epimerase
MNSSVLVTGGAGYIGTHVLVTLAASGRKCVCIDNYSNSSPRSLDRVEALAPGRIERVEMDISDGPGLRSLLQTHDIDSVIHLAGLKAVGESVEKPDLYYRNNVIGTRKMLEALAESSVRTFVFSSSATVYAVSDIMPLDESAPVRPQSPYGENKLEIERMLGDFARRDPTWRIANLRYFNPVGAHPSGMIGEDPSGAPNNLMPYVCQVAAGRRDRLRIFGNDYPTKDGTGVRDYIHVMDLAEGHIAALNTLRDLGGTVTTVNLGTGEGRSVLELVDTFERVNGVRVPREFVARRAGDIAECYADPSLAKRVLGWEANRGFEEMCRDAWNWQKKNPDGYVKVS